MNTISAVRLDALSQLDASALPTEFRLFQFGDNPTSKGTFKLDAEGAKEILAAYTKHGAELAIDYEHQTFESASNGKPAPAAGWFKPEVRSDGLWATMVRWTPRAAEMLRNREYRYFSPTFIVDKDKRITKLLPAALTNLPASEGQQALVAAKNDRSIAEAKRMLGSQPHTRTKMNISTLIGLKDDASEDEVSERVISLGRIERRLLEVTGKESVADAMSVLIAAKDAAVELDKARKQLTEWENRHAREEMETRRKAIDSIVESAVLDGRVSLKNVERQEQLRKHGEEYGVEALKTAVSLMEPRPVRQFQAPPPVNTVKAQLSAIEKWKKENPGKSAADAYVALSQTNPAMFADTAGVAVEE